MSGSNDHIEGGAERYGDATLEEAVKRLKAGRLVAVPTETVYGLAADSANAAAVASIYRTKGRPDFNPLIVHVADLDSALSVGVFNEQALQLAKKFWPGPLTLVVPRRKECGVTPAVTAGLDTIALRCPEHPIMQAVLQKSGLLLAAPSANKSGKISPTTAAHVHQSLGDDAPMIIDGGACHSGVESTIVVIRDSGYQILRPGPVTAEQLLAFTDNKALALNSDKIEAPGQLASHYAPVKSVRLNVTKSLADEYHIGFGATKGLCNLSQRADLAEAAANLFAILHIADASEKRRIAVAPVPMDGMGQAINDRLSRAAQVR